MKRSIVASLVSAVLLSFGVQALALPISPASPAPYATGDQTSQNQIDTAIASLLNGATELYKSNVGDPADVGPLAGSYDTEYFNTPTDPADALITYTGAPNPIIGDPKFLLVKDGNQSPAWYLFNLTSRWDGMADLELTGFWPNQGAISHVSLYGGSVPPPPVPEPGTILLLGAGLVGLALYSRKRAKA